MKKIFALLAFASVLCSVSAQRVNETVTLFGKEQLTGFTINVDNAPANIVADALADKFETQFAMKGSNKKGFRVYEGQACSAFGEARYDIYFTTTTVGKKSDQLTQVTLVVSNGNLNCITFANDPRTSRNIVAFLENLPNDVEIYKTKLRIKQLENELATLKKERESLVKNQDKLNDNLKATNDEIKRLSDKIEQKNSEIEKLQDQYNNSQDQSVKEQIAAAVKEKDNMQKTHSSKQKSLLKMNEDLYKTNTKLQTNAKATEEKETELQKLKAQLQ